MWNAPCTIAHMVGELVEALGRLRRLAVLLHILCNLLPLVLCHGGCVRENQRELTGCTRDGWLSTYVRFTPGWSNSTASSDLRWPLAMYNGAICQQPRCYWVRIVSSLRIAQLQK